MKHPPSSRLRRYILDEADASERLAVEAHLRECARCRAQVDQQAKLDEWLVESCPVPDQPHGTRDAFDRLWATVDGQSGQDAAPLHTDTADARRAASDGVRDTRITARVGASASGADGSAPRNWRRAAAWLLPVAIAAGLALVVRMRDDGPGPGDCSLDAQDAAPFAVGPMAAVPPSAAHVEHEDDAAERFDALRLQKVRSAIAGALREAAESHPTDEAAFAEACATACGPLREAGWPVPLLLRRLARDTEAATAHAALRLATLATDCDATLADALADADQRDVVLDRLVTAPARTAGAMLGSSLVAALAEVAGTNAPDVTLPRRLQSVSLLARDDQPAARSALARVLDAALRDAAGSPAAGGRESSGATADTRPRASSDAPDAVTTLAALAAAMPCEIATEVLLAGGARTSTRTVAASCFATLASGNRAAFGGALNSLLPRLPETGRRLAAQWAATFELPDALPGLCAALAEQPDDEELVASISSLGGEVAARGLAAALLSQSGRPSADGLVAALVSCLVQAPDDGPVAPAVAQVLAASRTEELLLLVRALPEARRGALLLAGLAALPADAAHQSRREGLLTALACEGSAQDGRRLMAWIDTRPDTDRILALAWTTAYCLSGEDAADAWQERGHDPSLLVSAAQDCGSWPRAAPAPPARRQRALDDTLRRATRAPPQTASASPSKETSR